MSNPVSDIPASKIFDVREVPGSLRHQQIFERFDALSEGDFFVLRNGHDPIPLRHQFEVIHPDAFLWEYLAPGPGFCQVKISKTKQAPATDPKKVTGCSCTH